MGATLAHAQHGDEKLVPDVALKDDVDVASLTDSDAAHRNVDSSSCDDTARTSRDASPRPLNEPLEAPGHIAHSRTQVPAEEPGTRDVMLVRGTLWSAQGLAPPIDGDSTIASLVPEVCACISHALRPSSRNFREQKVLWMTRLPKDVRPIPCLNRATLSNARKWTANGFGNTFLASVFLSTRTMKHQNPSTKSVFTAHAYSGR